MDNTGPNLPILSQSAAQLAKVFSELEVKIVSILNSTTDAQLRSIYLIIQRIGDRIAGFFIKIREIIKQSEKNRDSRFIVDYFFKNFSIISGHTKASGHIIKYVLNNPDWLKKHSKRIIERLKSLYADLLAMQIDCQELYKKVYNEDLKININFTGKEAGVGFKTRPAVQEIFNLESECKILGVEPTATRDQVKTAFRRIAKKMHPDINPQADRKLFMRVEQAYKRILTVVKD